MGEVEIEVFRNETREISVRNGKRPEGFHIAENDIRARGSDRDVGDSEISEVAETAEPHASELAETANASEGAEGSGEIGREVNGGNGAVEELERLESGKRFEGSEGQSDVVGAVGEAKRKKVTEWGRGVAESGIMKGGRRTWVSRSGNVKGLKGP